MEVKFIKDHPSGIKEGRIVTVAKHHADKWIEDGYAEEVTVKKSAPSTPAKKKAPAKKTTAKKK